MPQLLRGRRFEPHCPPVVLLTVTIDISKDNCGFAPFCNDSDQRCANLHRASQGAPCSALKLGSILQHHWCRLEAITAVRFAQSTKIDLKTFLEGVRLSQLFRLFYYKRTNSYAIDHPNQPIKLSKAQTV